MTGETAPHPPCACSGRRLCLLHFARLGTAERTRVAAGLGIRHAYATGTKP